MAKPDYSAVDYSAEDSVLGVQTPEGIEFVLYPAGFLIRACAWGIDSLIQGFLWLTILLSAGIMDRALGSWLSLILAFVLDWFYHTVFEVFFRGQSPGKRFMGIRVVRSDGSPINPGASFIRNLLRFADTFMFLYMIALVTMLVSRSFRRFGDLASDAIVVYTGAARSSGRFTAPALRRPVMPWLTDIPAASSPRRLNYEEKQAILSFARRYPILGKDRSDEIAGIWTAKLFARPMDSEAPETRPSPSDMLLGIARSIGG